MGESERELEVLARTRLPSILGEVLEVAPRQFRVRNPTRDTNADFVLVAPGHTFLVELLSRPTPATLSDRWLRLGGVATKKEVPVLVVPFMTEAGQTWCSTHDANWLDLSGNARIRAPGLHIRISGAPNAFARTGRPSSVFERRSSRLARVLLQNPGRVWTVRECAKQTGLDEGHVSRIVARLVEDRLLVRQEQRHFHVRDAGLLLDAWREAANFSKHRILKGHVAARTGDELLHVLSTRLVESNLGHAATGLGAAWLYDHFAMFRLVTLFVREWPSPEQLEQLHFREDAAGANVWLVLPNDDGVFDGARTVDEVPCVHPVQVYVDLKDQPERATEATEHLSANRALLGLNDATS